MKRRIGRLAVLLALGVAVPAHSQAQVTAPYTLNVRVQVANLPPQVVRVLVMCQVKSGDTPIMTSQYMEARLTQRGFNGIVKVPLRSTSPNLAQQLGNARYECLLYLQDAPQTTMWYPTATPGEAAPDRRAPANWQGAYPEPGTPFTPIITGPFPPRTQTQR